MGAIGEMLRRERLKSDRDLDRIAHETKIPARLLQAIECEEFDKLPGRLFTISFVRQYAQNLGLDEEQVVADLRAQQEPPPAAIAEAAPPRPQREVSKAAVGGGAGVLLILAIGYGFLQSSRPPRVATTEGPVAAVTKGSADRVVEPARREPQAAPSATQPPSPGTPSELRLVVTAKERSWVTAKLDHHSLFSGMLQPNESKIFEGTGPMDLVAGNPAGLEVRLNGQPLDLTGPRGQLAEVQIAWPSAVPVILHRKPLEDIY